MSSTQRPARRRSARLAFDEEDTRPAKKAKTTEEGPSGSGIGNGTGNTTAVNGRKGAAAGKKTKAVYDEDVDGFQFSKTRSRKGTSKESAPPEPATSTNAPEPPPVAPPRKKTTITNVTATEDAQPRKTRKSARLSADGEQVQPPTRSKASTRNEPEAVRLEQRTERAKTPGAAEKSLHVEKKRGPTKIALPFADTPVITRNKEMRKNSAQGSRRSSSSMRGRRASSLIDSGTSNAMPHGEVSTAEFYKHISQDLPEPRRMQQLLSWCATRALPEKPSGTSENVNAILAARVIQEELLKDFSKKSELSDWFNREDTAPTALIKKPNPRNTQMVMKLQELEREMKRLEEEKRTWDQVLKSLSSSIPDEENSPSDELVPTADSIKSSLVDHPEHESILSTLLSQPALPEETYSRLQTATENLEFTIDKFAEGVHRLEKLKEAAQGVTETVQRNAADALEQRDRVALEKTGMEKVGVGDILRKLSRARS